MTDTKHTSLPWKISNGFSPDIMTVIESVKGGDIDYLTLGNHKANAAFIVKAVNSHDKLVEALENLIEEVLAHARSGEVIPHTDHRIKEAREALELTKS